MGGEGLGFAGNARGEERDALVGYNWKRMRISRLEIEQFRSYGKRTLRFGDLSVIVGPNASGKTNILEAIYLIATGESFRARKIEEMVKWEAELGRVTGLVETKGEAYSLGVTLTRGVLMGKRTQKRRYLVDGMPRSKAKFLGHFSVILFRPEDLRLIEGSPTRRRGFLNEVLAGSDSEYFRALRAYEQALRRRNKILDAIREGEATRAQLTFWDHTLIKNGNVLSSSRREFLEYLSGVEVTFGKYEIEYDYSAISEKRLEQYEREEVAVGYTLVGPHKDDFSVMSLNGGGRRKDLAIYGSRGEQRLGVLFLKLGTLAYVEKKYNERPVLLLDDIFSELDEQHRKEVLKMTDNRQTVITTVDEYLLDEFLGKEIGIIRL